MNAFTDSHTVNLGHIACASKIDFPGRDPAGSGAAVRIFTLGRFGVVVDGAAICAVGKSKQKPLSMLKVVLALGGRDIAASRVWECLWPDSEGDLAVANYTVTLHRLRRMLGWTHAIHQTDGKLTLDDRLCWVDAWSFERAAGEILDSLAGVGGVERLPEGELRSALKLYSGHFLDREAEESWMLCARLRLRSKFERLVAAASVYLESHGRTADAIDLCEQSLERDPLNELIYRRQMACYLACGETAQVLRVYRKCRDALMRGLGVAPTQDTEGICTEAMRAGRDTHVPAKPSHARQFNGRQGSPLRALPSNARL